MSTSDSIFAPLQLPYYPKRTQCNQHTCTDSAYVNNHIPQLTCSAGHKVLMYFIKHCIHNAYDNSHSGITLSPDPPVVILSSVPTADL